MDVKLSKIGMGALEERFADELIKVIQNVQDPNTDPRAARKIEISIEIKPIEDDRDMCTMKVGTKVKLAPDKTMSSTLALGIDGHGVIHANEIVPQQQSLWTETPRIGGEDA